MSYYYLAEMKHGVNLQNLKDSTSPTGDSFVGSRKPSDIPRPSTSRKPSKQIPEHKSTEGKYPKRTQVSFRATPKLLPSVPGVSITNSDYCILISYTD